MPGMKKAARRRRFVERRITAPKPPPLAEPKAEFRIPQSFKCEHAFDWATRIAVEQKWRGLELTIHSRVPWYYELHQQLRMTQISRLGLRAREDSLEIVARGDDGTQRGLLARLPWEDPVAVMLLHHVFVLGDRQLSFCLTYSRQGRRHLASRAKVGVDPSSGVFPEAWQRYDSASVMDIASTHVSGGGRPSGESLADVVQANNTAIAEGPYEAMPVQHRGVDVGLGYGD